MKNVNLTESEAQTVRWIMNEWLLEHPDHSIQQYNRKLNRVVRELTKEER